LKRRQINGAEPCAVATAHILLQVVAKSKWQDVDSLLSNVSRVGRRLVAARPNELVIGNIVRRVLGLIRDEAVEDRNELGETTSEGQMTPTNPMANSTNLAHHLSSSTVAKQDSAGDYITSVATPARPGPLISHSTINVPKSLFHLLSASPPVDGEGQGSPFGTSGASTPLHSKTSSSQVHALRSEVIDGIEEIKDEISQVDDQIAALAEVQVHPGDYLMVHQPSPTVERFILRAAMRRKFTVLIATEPPRKSGEQGPQYASFRKKLSSAGITVVNVMNGGLMAYMSKVNKVILGAKAIVANGGVVSDAGAVAIARAAKAQGNAVIVLGGVYKLSPENPFGEEAVIEWADPSTFVNFSDGKLVDSVEVRTASTEIVPPHLVDTYITNL
jgi:translation initiation factor eIF-2B subunit beta